MTYLSSVRFDPASRATFRDVTNSQDMHRTLCRLVTGGQGPAEPSAVRSEHEMLHRVRVTGDGVEVLVQSKQPLHMDARPDHVFAEHRQIDLTDVVGSLSFGDRVRYDAVVSPVRSFSRTPDGEKRARSRKISITAPGDVADWFVALLDGSRRDDGLVSGLSQVFDGGVPVIRADPVDAHSVHRQGQRFQHKATRVIGHATVSDPAALMALVRRGVGPGKAYGSGLLLLARV